MKIMSLPWVLVPGLGQIRGGAPGLGVVYFALFILALNGYLLGILLVPDSGLRFLGWVAALLWLVSLIDGIRRLARRPA
jgi:hypothetical protein